VVNTGPRATVGIILRDNSLLSIGPDSEVSLDSFQMDAIQSSLGMTFRQGTFSMATGQLARERARLRLRTSSAVIGVQGTQFALLAEAVRPVQTSTFGFQNRDVYRPPGRETLLVLLPDPEGEVGSVSLETVTGGQTLTEAGAATGFSALSAPPRVPEILPDSEVQLVFGETLNAQPPPVAEFLLYFEIGADTLTSDSRADIPAILAAIQSRDSRDISVVGYTDRVGNAFINARLSEERAARVRDLLVAEGVDPDWLELRGMGEALPRVETPDEVAEPLNRRVEVYVR
jgi:outer membrane protein OmpA-like peptidoglycan-associated protein